MQHVWRLYPLLASCVFPFSISSVFGSTFGTWRVLKCRCCIFHFSPQETRRTIACYVRTVGSSRGVNSAPTHLLVGWAENLCFLLASFELSIVTLTPPRVQKKRDDDFLEEKSLISLKLHFAGTIAYRFELHFFWREKLRHVTARSAWRRWRWRQRSSWRICNDGFSCWREQLGS